MGGSLILPGTGRGTISGLSPEMVEGAPPHAPRLWGAPSVSRFASATSPCRGGF